MKGPIKSALSVALALAASQAFALGLGPIQIKSGLNQPLLAEIPIVADSAAEAEDLRVDLASAEDFVRVGLNRARVTVPIEFSVANNGRGQRVIRLTTKEAVREPFLDFLIEANWGKGKLLREYTVLLDPPVTAPAVLATAPKPAEKPKPVEAAPRAPVSQPRAEAPKPVAQAAPAPTPAPRPAPAASPAPAAPTAAHKGEYTVQRGDTLSQIAHEVGDDPRDLNRTLLALYKANPEAFYRENMNALKTGAVLRIPSADEVRAAGSLNEAAAAVRAQQQSWQESVAPTLVANTGAAAATDKQAAAPAAEQKHGSERLALVPPSSGTGNEAGASKGGSAAGSKDAAALRSDLARTKEALTSREQETGELKSRVSQLEEINNKSQRLISLKDSEIAELQNKLKQLEAGKAGAKPTDTSAAATKPAAPAPEPAATAATPSAAPAATPVAAPAPSATAPTTAATPPPPAAAAPAQAATQAPAAPAAAASTSPSAATPAPSQAAAPKPVTATATKPAAPATGKPWYADYVDNPYVLYGGTGGILLLIAGWLMTRASGGKKPNPRPLAAGAAAAAEAADADPHAALEQEVESYYDGAPGTDAAQPSRAGLDGGEEDEMEQLRSHFDHGDSERFVALAHTLREKFPEDSAEWREASELGRQLLPGSPLFAASGSHDGHDPDDFFFRDEAAHAGETAAENEHDAHIQAMLDHDEPLAFESRDMVASDPHDLPDLEFEQTFHKEVEAVTQPPIEEAQAGAERAPFLDEDTIGTRLDLARAYLDMGDPEGARSMLDEVLAEGNAVQKEEARKLLSELS